MSQIQRLKISNFIRFAFVAVFIAGVLLSCPISSRIQPMDREIDTTNAHLELLWMSNSSLWFQDADWNSNKIYAYTTKEKLLSFDSETGSIFWEKNLPSQELGIRGLVAINQSLFTITSTDIYRYASFNGERVWATHIGDGHVPINIQNAEDSLNVYYGERVFNVSTESGNISDVSSDAKIYWMGKKVLILQSSLGMNSGMNGIERSTGKVLWENAESSFRIEEWFPVQSLGQSIFVLTDDLGICSFNFFTGEYIWCLPDKFISNLGVNTVNRIGYILDGDFLLLEIDLDTGQILAETQFLPRELPEDMRSRGFEYTISVTKDAVVVSFSDSVQTFGLRIAP